MLLATGASRAFAVIGAVLIVAGLYVVSAEHIGAELIGLYPIVIGALWSSVAALGFATAGRRAYAVVIVSSTSLFSLWLAVGLSNLD